MNRTKIIIDITPGYQIAMSDGLLESDSPCHMATEFFYPMSKGDYIECRDEGYVFAVATFSDGREEKYLYTYDYKQDSAWVTYRRDLAVESYSKETYVFEKDGFCRICVKKADGGLMSQTDADRINMILDFYVKERSFEAKNCFVSEIADTVEKVRTVSHEIGLSPALGFVLLTDSHYTVNGTWDDTADNIAKVVKGLSAAACEKKSNNQEEEYVHFMEPKLGGIIHLGDFTDGMTTKKVTRTYTRKMLDDISLNGLPVYVTLGNHDFNYFRGNKQRFSAEEQKEAFGLDTEYYYHDFDEQKIRCLFLSSYDINTPVRYGFSVEEVKWVEQTLEETPAGYKVLVFAHEAPLDNLDYWARIIRNGRELMEVLESYNAKEDRHILAYIHGHTHAEHVYRGSSFPIISIGCNKCEYFPDKKPEGSHAYMRKPGTVTQDLWDVLMVDAKASKLHFVRFGAGDDRVIDCGKTKSTWREAEASKKAARTTKIWAHRGASGFAPENTLPAFEVAKMLNVDGIELDVQMTKDGEIVVIHDETIDRTSDGTGRVKDLTLAKLRRFNYAKDKPIYGFVTVPTLRQVYEMFQGTDYIINVELKTGVVAYVGIEEKVHALTVEMGMEEQVIYSSFNHASVLKMQEYVTAERTAFLLEDEWQEAVEYGVSHNVQALHPDRNYLGLETLVKEAHEKGLKVHVWTVNEEADALRLRELGVDAIITNHPGRMRECFADN